MRRQSFLYQIRKGGYVALMAISAFLLSIIPLLWNLIFVTDISTWTKADLISLSQLIIILISAIIALITIRSNRKTACEVATLSAILDDYKDTEFYDAKMRVYAYNKNNKGSEVSLTSLFEQEEDYLDNSEQQKIKKATMLILNRSEFFAAAVNAGILNENLYKRTHCRNVIRVWEELSTVVICLRQKTGAKTLFLELEILSSRWNINPLKTEDIL